MADLCRLEGEDRKTQEQAPHRVRPHRPGDTYCSNATKQQTPAPGSKPESLWPGEFRAGLTLPDGRVDFGSVLWGYINSGFLPLRSFQALPTTTRQTKVTNHYCAVFIQQMLRE
jgi:hypothetical protein